MSRTFAYVSASTIEQTSENQIQEIKAAGFNIEPHRIITETVSGWMAIAQRKGFSRLLDKIGKGDILIVTKLDRVGRDTVDVSMTASKLENIGLRLHCLALGGIDLTSSAGKMIMNVINAVTQFARELLIEWTQAGLIREKEQGKSLGRPFTLSGDQQQVVKQKITNGETISAIARHFITSGQTILRIKKQA